jgi:hypothetical protein
MVRIKKVSRDAKTALTRKHPLFTMQRQPSGKEMSLVPSSDEIFQAETLSPETVEKFAETLTEFRNLEDEILEKSLQVKLLEQKLAQVQKHLIILSNAMKK